MSEEEIKEEVKEEVKEEKEIDELDDKELTRGLAD